MTRITWNEAGTRLFEAGVDRGVFFPQDGPGVPWNGLSSVKEAPSGGDVSASYFDGKKYLTQRAVEGFAGTIEAFTYPDEFIEYDGVGRHLISQQQRKYFGFSYRTAIGNDLEGIDHGYKLHLVYNAMVSPAGKDYATISENAEALNFSWNFTTLPILISGAKASSHLVIDSTKAHPWTLEAIENVLYGSVDGQPVLPAPADVVEIFEENAVLRVTDNGDGTWTATGPDEAITMLDSTTFEITWESALYIDDKTYTLTSL